MASATQICPNKHPLIKDPSGIAVCTDCDRRSSAFMTCAPCKYVRCMNCVRGVKPLDSSVPKAPPPSYTIPLTSFAAKKPAAEPEVDLDALLAQLSADPGVIAYEAEQKAAAAAAPKPTALKPAAPALKPAAPAYTPPSTYKGLSTTTTTSAPDQVDLDKLLASLSVDATTPAAAKFAPVGIHTIISEQKNVSKYGYNDGEISINVSGGKPWYYFKWEPSCNAMSNGAIAKALLLAPGEYTLTVDDDGNNITTQKFVITGPPKPAGGDEAVNGDSDDDDDYAPSVSRSSSGSRSTRSEKPAKPAKPATRKCPSCHGSGRKACGRNNCTSKCSNCGGARKVTCNVCKGKGEIRN